MRLPNHPDPVPGAALYYAENRNVIMKTNDGYPLSVIDVKRTAEAAAKSACAWQKRENAAVTRERKRQEKIAKTA